MKLEEFLKLVANEFGPGGYEQRVVELIKKNISKYSDSVKIDKSGNLIAIKRGNGKGKLLLEAHVDEIGLVVSKIVSQDYIRIHMVGGVDFKILPGQRLRIFGRDGKIYRGVVGMLAPHLQKSTERNKAIEYDELFVDVSMNVEKPKIGDMAVFDVPTSEFGDGLITGKALDNRSSCAVIFEVFKSLSKIKHEVDVYALFSVKEETSGIGATTGGYAIEPDVAIILDVTHADVKDPTAPDIKLGYGPALGFGPMVDKEIFSDLKKIALDNNIAYQLEPLPGRSGTDADNLQLVKKGIKTGLVSIPLKYMHTPVEIVSLKDLKETVRLLTSYIISLNLEG
ncbi:MAG: M20/M25/M40 family metallo-hydrolase [Thermotogae bacterium]|nr:M20/M25/M40 family metallo-hydrolase [Thermotogota bacterium]